MITRRAALQREAIAWWSLDTGGHGAQPPLRHIPGWEKFELNVRAAGSGARPATDVVILDAEDSATPALVRQYTRNNRLAGVRLFGGRKPDGSMPWLNSPAALKTWEVAQELGLVMDVEVLSHGGGGPSIPAIIELTRQYPDIRIVLDHLLEPEMEEGKHFGLDERYEKLAGEKNIYFKFTSINLDICREADIPAEKVLRRAADMFDADHLMWGSDIGTSSGAYKDMVQRFLDSAVLLTAAEMQAVAHDTGKRVFVKGGNRA